MCVKSTLVHDYVNVTELVVMLDRKIVADVAMILLNELVTEKHPLDAVVFY